VYPWVRQKQNFTCSGKKKVKFVCCEILTNVTLLASFVW